MGYCQLSYLWRLIWQEGFSLRACVHCPLWPMDYGDYCPLPSGSPRSCSCPSYSAFSTLAALTASPLVFTITGSFYRRPRRSGCGVTDHQGNQTIRRQTSSRSVKSWTGQLADWITRGLDNSRTGQLAYMFDAKFWKKTLAPSVIFTNSLSTN